MPIKLAAKKQQSERIKKQRCFPKKLFVQERRTLTIRNN
jgi:hypothetical protein